MQRSHNKHLVNPHIKCRYWDYHNPSRGVSMFYSYQYTCDLVNWKLSPVASFSILLRMTIYYNYSIMSLKWVLFSIAIFRICMASFQGFLPRAQNFSQGFMKKNLSFRLIWSSNRSSSEGDVCWLKVQRFSSSWELQLLIAASGFAISRRKNKKQNCK